MTPRKLHFATNGRDIFVSAESVRDVSAAPGSVELRLFPPEKPTMSIQTDDPSALAARIVEAVRVATGAITVTKASEAP